MSCRPVGRWLFGKLPTQGDFVSRGLELPLRASLDSWLSREMQAARAAFLDFAERYDSAPAWNFVDRDSEGRWSGGALCASVDRVGRHFPMIMAAPAEDAADATGISAACMAALCQAFAEGWDADSLITAELFPIELPWSPTGAEWVLLGEYGPAFVASKRFPDGIVTAMLEVAL